MAIYFSLSAHKFQLKTAKVTFFISLSLVFLVTNFFNSVPVEHSNTSQDLREEEECLAYILPNETHVLAATNISESLIDPLTLAPLTYCTDIGASEECKTQVLGSTQLNPLSSSKIGKPLKSINNLTKKLAKIAHCPTSNNGEILLQVRNDRSLSLAQDSIFYF